MSYEKVSFKTKEGHTLHAILDKPDSAPKAYALFAHCFTGSKNFKTTAMLSQSLMKKGFAVLRFDFTGLGESDGDFADTNFSSNVDDILAAAEYLRKNCMAPSLLFGHSFGGAAVLGAASQIPELKTVATVNAPFDPSHVTHLFEESLSEIQTNGEAHVCLAGRRFTIKQQFVDDINAKNMACHIGKIKVPLMIFHAPEDKTVHVENARLIYQAANHPKNYISLDDADHFLTHKDDAKFVAEILASWSSKYINRSKKSESDAFWESYEGSGI